MDYQKTINLPKTDFPMRAGLVQKEPQLLAQWEKDGVYAQIRAKSEGRPRFILHDGPPYANGHIHIGHVLNKVLKDFVVKMKTMQGFDSLYIPGWDCHGLPIEHQLFKDLKKKKSEVNTLELRKKAHDYAMKFVGIQREDFKRLGIFGEWDNPYLTLAPEYEYWILTSLAKLTRDGYVYRGLKPVNWCAHCETALAEAEVEYEDHTSPSVYVRFKVKNPEKAGYSGGKPLHLLIWTTTPWTLLANVAVAVHPKFKYVLVETGRGEVLIIEDSLAMPILEKAGLDGAKVIKRVEGKDLTGLVYTHPFDLKDNCRVITMEYVTKEDGTGLVHTAPGHGQEDFEAGKVHQLDILMPVDDRGLFTQQGGKFAGQHVFKANDAIIEDLKTRGLLLLSQPLVHSYPHCWRCKQPIIFRATEQWFLAVDHQGLREKLKSIISHNVQWVPPMGQERILGMITTRPDWCLSRQRHWGVPIPALACSGCGGHKLFPQIIEHFADVVRKKGSDVWFEKDLKDLLPPGFKCPDCGRGEFAKTHDILDVWFDSGVSHQAVAGPMLGQEIPLDLYLEGSDQHRGWFQSSLIPAVAMFGKAPFRAVLTHGFVVDGLGRKMSKSLGNVISPQDVMGKNGAEILRLWVASSDYHDDIRLSSEIFERLVDAYRKIRNTLRFLLSNLHGFDPDKDRLSYDQLTDLDRWALYRLQEVASEAKAAYNAYDFAKVYKLIYSYCNEDLSGFYLDILKDRLYTSHVLSAARMSAQTVLYDILNHLVRILAPILVFTTDETFQYMPKDRMTADAKSVHVLNWPDDVPEWNNAHIKERFEWLFQLRPYVLKALEDKRSVNEIGKSLEAKLVFRTASDRDYQLLEQLKDVLPEIFIVSQVDIRRVSEIKAGISEQFSKTKIGVEKAEGNKCCRCWKHLPEVGQHKEHPDLCGHCVDVVRQVG